MGIFFRYALREHEERVKPLVLVECGEEGVTTVHSEGEKGKPSGTLGSDKIQTHSQSTVIALSARAERGEAQIFA